MSKWANFLLYSRQRPYHVENTSSRPITEVKQRWARLVLGWETAWEPLVQLSFCFQIPSTSTTGPKRSFLLYVDNRQIKELFAKL